MRAIGLAVFISVIAAMPAMADDAAARRDLIDGMRRGFAEGAKDNNAPNLIEILQSRFPDYLDRFADKFLPDQRAGKSIDPRRIGGEVARLFVEVQSREAKRIQTAPASSLKAVVAAQRGLIETALREQPNLCVVFVTESEARPSPTQETGRWSLVRLAAIFNALADGRDMPVGNRQFATDADWAAFSKLALKRGVDVKSWSRLLPQEAKNAPAPAVCEALLSSLDAITATDGELGEKLLASHVSSLLTIDPAVYRRVQ